MILKWVTLVLPSPCHSPPHILSSSFPFPAFFFSMQGHVCEGLGVIELFRAFFRPQGVQNRQGSCGILVESRIALRVAVFEVLRMLILSSSWMICFFFCIFSIFESFTVIKQALTVCIDYNYI